MFEKNVSEQAKNSMEMQPVIDEMPERIKFKDRNKKKEDFINWYVGSTYDQFKDMSLDDLMLFLLRSYGEFMFNRSQCTREDEINLVIDTMVERGFLQFVDDEDGVCHLKPLDK